MTTFRPILKRESHLMVISFGILFLSESVPESDREPYNMVRFLAQPSAQWGLSQKPLDSTVMSCQNQLLPTAETEKIFSNANTLRRLIF